MPKSLGVTLAIGAAITAGAAHTFATAGQKVKALASDLKGLRCVAARRYVRRASDLSGALFSEVEEEMNAPAASPPHIHATLCTSSPLGLNFGRAQRVHNLLKCHRPQVPGIHADIQAATDRRHPSVIVSV